MNSGNKVELRVGKRMRGLVMRRRRYGTVVAQRKRRRGTQQGPAARTVALQKENPAGIEPHGEIRQSRKGNGLACKVFRSAGVGRRNITCSLNLRQYFSFILYLIDLKHLFSYSDY
jgi:hypothetical protein